MMAIASDMPAEAVLTAGHRTDRSGAIAIALLGIGIVMAFALQSMVTLVGGVGLCLLFVIHYRRLLTIDARIMTRALVVLFLFVPAFFKPGHGLSPIFYLFSTGVTFATAYVISRFSAAAIHRAATIIYWFFAAIVGAILILYWGTPEPFGEVIEGSSTNAIPAYMIVIQLFLCVTTFIMTGRAPILTPALTLMIAFFGNGRGSLVVGSLLVAGSLVINLFPRNVSFLYRALLMAISLVAMVEIATHATELYDYASRYTKLSVGIEDRNRGDILSSYLAEINPYTFFFGAEYEGTIIDIQYKGNPHISFIRTHSFFGIFALLMALLSPFTVFFSRGRWSLKLPIFFFVSLAVVRAGSEPILFPTLLDVFYFLMIIMYFRARDSGESVHA